MRTGKGNIRAQRARYRKRYPEKRQAQRKRYKKRYPERYNESVRKANHKVRTEALVHYSGSEFPFCAKCWEKNIEFLEIDHINGGGKAHLREINGNLPRWLKRHDFPDGFQVLCSNCNIKKVKDAARLKGTAGTKIQRRDWRKNERLRMAAFAHYAKDGIISCDCCGETDTDVLCLDHINGDGAEHRRSLPKTMAAKMYKWVRQNNYPPGFRILCHNCNQSLGKYGYCPHNKT